MPGPAKYPCTYAIDIGHRRDESWYWRFDGRQDPPFGRTGPEHLPVIYVERTQNHGRLKLAPPRVLRLKVVPGLSHLPHTKKRSRLQANPPNHFREPLLIPQGIKNWVYF
jgi:hypothetical protein